MEQLKEIMDSIGSFSIVIAEKKFGVSFPRRRTFFILSKEIIPYVLIGVYQEPPDMIINMDNI